ncbi:MAG TPA: hypothetical protein VF092_16645 [Longimicrobium sp.]
MKKLSLDLDRLAVDSFAVDAGGGGGTVAAHEAVTQAHSCYDTVCCPVTRYRTCTC